MTINNCRLMMCTSSISENDYSIGSTHITNHTTLILNDPWANRPLEAYHPNISLLIQWKKCTCAKHTQPQNIMLTTTTNLVNTSSGSVGNTASASTQSSQSICFTGLTSPNANSPVLPLIPTTISTLLEQQTNNDINNNTNPNNYNRPNTQTTTIIQIPEILENLTRSEHFPILRHRWNTNEEIASLLIAIDRHERWLSSEVRIR